jgi:hypothetical protein
MQPAGPALVPRTVAVLPAVLLLCLCFLPPFSTSTLAQGLQRGSDSYTLAPGAMPPWAVPVLRLVSSTHVEPTTGIVISDTGFVLVPEDFVSMGDEIIVLDGGTDILRNGRPARIERKFFLQGLQVLYVEGLRRTGVTLAAGLPAEGSEVTLTAFPPAEQIAEGEPPLSVKAQIVIFEETGNPAISGETRLPNVTGGLVDACGNLVGISIADDVQSMEPSSATRYQWRKTLLDVLAEMQVTPRESGCSGQPEQPLDEAVAGQPAIPEPEAAAEEPAAQETIVPQEEPAVVEETLPEEPPITGADDEEPISEILPPVEQDAGDDGAARDENGTGNWPWLLAALVLFGAGFILHRLRRSGREENSDAAGHVAAVLPPELQDGEDKPDLAHTALDSLLVVRGVLADGSGFETSCPVSEHAINVTIGRGDADLIIESKAISRRHVNLNGTWRALTVSDLGSSNGTSINGVPCLEGEIMFIEGGDELVLGDARCTIEIRPRNNPAGAEK